MDDSPPRWLKLQVPGYRLLLYRFDIEAESYCLYLTDLSRVWLEALPYQKILQRADTSSNGIGSPYKGIDPGQNLAEFYRFLGVLEEGLGADPSDLVQRTLSQTQSLNQNSMVLHLKLSEARTVYFPAHQASQSQSQPDTSPALGWTFHLAPLAPTDPRFLLAFQTLILGLVGVVDAQGQQISELTGLLRKKDFHLRHLREEIGHTTEPRIHVDAWRQFKPEAWQSDWTSVRLNLQEKGTEDVDVVLGRAVTERAKPLWGFHAHGCRWAGSMLMRDDGLGALPLKSSASSKKKKKEVPEGLLPSSPPPFEPTQQTQQPPSLHDDSTASEDEPIAAGDDDAFATSSLPNIKEEPECTPVPSNYDISSSPLRSPHKRRRPLGLNPSEPPSPSPKKRMRTETIPLQPQPVRSALALEMEAKRRPPGDIPLAPLAASAASVIAANNGSTIVTDGPSRLVSSLQSSSNPIPAPPTSSSSSTNSTSTASTSAQTAAITKPDPDTTTSTTSTATSNSTDSRRKELELRVAGKTGKPTRPKRRF